MYRAKSVISKQQKVSFMQFTHRKVQPRSQTKIIQGSVENSNN